MFILIHSADPQKRPVVIIVFAHVVRPSVRPSIPSFPSLAKQNKFQAKTMFTTGETESLAEWIIDDTCMYVPYLFVLFPRSFPACTDPHSYGPRRARRHCWKTSHWRCRVCCCYNCCCPWSREGP